MSPLSWLEAAWIAVSLMGTSVNFLALIYAIGDRRALLSQNLNGGRRKAARIRLRTTAAMLAIQVMFLFVGLWLGVTPPAPPRPETAATGYTPQGFAFIGSVMLAELILAGVSLLSHVEWRQLVAMGEREILDEMRGRRWDGKERRRR